MSDKNVYRWSLIDRVSIALINFSVNIVLVRMLTADDFGLLAMIYIFVAVAMDLSACGLADGIIHKPNPTETDYSTVFVFNSAMGIIFGSAFFFGAPLIARFFGHDELILIMRCLGVCFLFQAMSYVQETRLRKQLKMKALCFARVGATLTVSAVGIVAAYLGYGYKALICTQIFLSVFFFIGYTVATRWFPRLRFSTRSFKELFGYGFHLMLAYLATLVGRNINTSVLGREFTPDYSGIYYQGAKLSNVPFNVLDTSLNATFFVVASNEAANERRRTLFLDMFNTLLLVCGTVGALLLIMAAPLIEFLYGDRWIAAIPVFRILVAAEMFACFRSFFQAICKVYARTRFIRNMGFAEVSFQLVLLAIFYRFGILAIAWTQTAAVIAAVAVYAWRANSSVQVSIRQLIGRAASVIWIPLLAAAAAGATLWALKTFVAPDCAVAAIWQCLAGAAAFSATFIAAGELSRNSAYLALRSKILPSRP